MISFLGGALVFILAVLLVAAALLLVGALALGTGWVLGLVFPVTVFEGALVMVASVGVAALYLGLKGIRQAVEEISDEYLASVGQEEEEEDEETVPVRTGRPLVTGGQPVTPFVRRAPVGRNDPCPCGSGRKYKYCCGRNQ